MNSDHDLASQLRNIESNLEVRRQEPRKDPLQLFARLEEGETFEPGSWIEFRPIMADKKVILNNTQHLFSQLREAMRKLTGDYSWSIRYASQIKRENMPFLHSSNTRCIMFDPFLPFRDPVREFFQQRVFLWQIFPSNSYYFKTQGESRSVAAELDLQKQLLTASRRQAILDENLRGETGNA